MQSDHSYQRKIDRLHAALHALPTSLPSGSSIYDFRYWTPDPNKLDLLGAPCSVLNADLENIFGLRAVTPLTFQERGTGIESIVDLFSYYLTGDFREKALLSKWVEDLSNAAEEMSQSVTENVIELEVFESTDNGHDECGEDETSAEDVDIADSMDDEIGSDDGEEVHEAVIPDAKGFDVTTVYGVDLRNPVLLDLLADQAVEGVEGAQAESLGPESSRKRPSEGQLSAKKDVSAVNLDVF